MRTASYLGLCCVLMFTKSATAQVGTAFRPDDNRPVHNAARLADMGIHLYESERLKLYTDIAPELARPLPNIIDQVYLAWEAYLGKMLPDSKRTPWQVTGYLMKDESLFQKAGLIPADLRKFFNGRHRGREFWMYDQNFDYYRRHLLIHEATHSFMTTMPGVQCPVWYLEGMAELFGTHQLDENGKATFRVMPDKKSDFLGQGRIRLIQEANERGDFHSLKMVQNLNAPQYLKPEPYAWSWALCYFLDQHPRYQHRFRQLSRATIGNQFAGRFQQLFGSDIPNLSTEWAMFAHQLEYGYQLSHAWVDVQSGKPVTLQHYSRVLANRGWQCSRLRVEKGKTYQISARGKFALAQEPKLWESTAEGITLRYANGKPEGLLLGAVLADESSTENSRTENPLTPFLIGSSTRWKCTTDGVLYFRVNEFWNELSNNTGHLLTSVHEVQD